MSEVSDKKRKHEKEDGKKDEKRTKKDQVEGAGDLGRYEGAVGSSGTGGGGGDDLAARVKQLSEIPKWLQQAMTNKNYWYHYNGLKTTKDFAAMFKIFHGSIGGKSFSYVVLKNAEVKGDRGPNPVIIVSPIAVVGGSRKCGEYGNYYTGVGQKGKYDADELSKAKQSMRLMMTRESLEKTYRAKLANGSEMDMNPSLKFPGLVDHVEEFFVWLRNFGKWIAEDMFSLTTGDAVSYKDSLEARLRKQYAKTEPERYDNPEVLVTDMQEMWVDDFMDNLCMHEKNPKKMDRNIAFSKSLWKAATTDVKTGKAIFSFHATGDDQNPIDLGMQNKIPMDYTPVNISFNGTQMNVQRNVNGKYTGVPHSIIGNGDAVRVAFTLHPHVLSERIGLSARMKEISVMCKGSNPSSQSAMDDEMEAEGDISDFLHFDDHAGTEHTDAPTSGHVVKPPSSLI